MKLVVRDRSPCNSPINYGTIAPMVEQWTENSCVAGSSPAYGTNFCQCQQEKDTIESFFEEPTIVKQREARILSKKIRDVG